jgi:hypothetical protein
MKRFLLPLLLAAAHAALFARDCMFSSAALAGDLLCVGSMDGNHYAL